MKIVDISIVFSRVSTDCFCSTGGHGRYSGLATLCRHFVARKALLFKCSWNGLHSQACALVAGGILADSPLQELDLSDNMCGLDPIGNRCNDGIRQLTQAIGRCHQLRVLKLARNFLFDQEVHD